MISYQKEWWRKAIHLSSLWIPAGMIWGNHSLMLIAITVLTLLVLLLDVLRYFYPDAPIIRSCLAWDLLREHEVSVERWRPCGASFMIVAATICAWCFSPDIVALAFGVLVISDSCAALVGRRWGCHYVLGKSLEGSAAFILSGMIVVIFISFVYNHPPFYYIAGMVALIVAAIIELFATTLRIDDNIAIPIAYALVMYLLVS